MSARLGEMMAPVLIMAGTTRDSGESARSARDSLASSPTATSRLTNQPGASRGGVAMGIRGIALWWIDWSLTVAQAAE